MLAESELCIIADVDKLPARDPLRGGIRGKANVDKHRGKNASRRRPGKRSFPPQLPAPGRVNPQTLGQNMRIVLGRQLRDHPRDHIGEVDRTRAGLTFPDATIPHPLPGTPPLILPEPRVRIVPHVPVHSLITPPPAPHTPLPRTVFLMMRVEPADRERLATGLA